MNRCKSAQSSLTNLTKSLNSNDMTNLRSKSAQSSRKCLSNTHNKSDYKSKIIKYTQDNELMRKTS